jgi:putative FmdB family regulatory protein
MPTYEYKCDACGHAFERFQSITAEPVRKCPQCGKNKVRRLIGTGAGLIFKGSGFYITDYRDKSYTDKAKAESGSAAGSANGDAKADAKAEPKPAETRTQGNAEGKPKPEPKPAAKSEGKPSKKK